LSAVLDLKQSATMEATTVAKPMNELAVQNAKYAAECTELHLAKRGITMLWDRDSFGKNEFERFINLEVLWCNDNQLIRLDGLDSNFRMKMLFAHNNKITSIKVSRATTLETATSLRLPFVRPPAHAVYASTTLLTKESTPLPTSSPVCRLPTARLPPARKLGDTPPAAPPQPTPAFT